MRNYKSYLYLMAFLPWLSLPFLGERALKRFLPGALFISFFVMGESFVARKKVWWWFYKKPFSKGTGMAPLVIGPFFVSALWILKFTYGKFLRFFMVILAVDSFFTYILMDWFKRVGYVSLVRMKKYQFSFVFLIKSFLMYAFQYVYEKGKSYKSY